MEDNTNFLTMSDGTKIAYDVHGEGVPMLMIHGVTDSKETYDTDLPYLTKAFKVYRYDLRGHGRSSHPKKAFDLNHHIADALEVINQLNLNNFVLYGGSLGSYISQGAAIKVSAKIKALILNVSAAKNPASALAQTSKADQLPTKADARRQYWVKKLVHDPKNVARVEKSGFQKYALNPEDEYRALKSITAYDFSHQLDKITCPTIVTSGTYDPVNPPVKGKLVAKLIKHSQFAEFPSGHLLRLELTAAYWEKVLTFVKSHLS